MKKFFTLLKVDLINGFSLNKNFGKNKKNRKASKSSNLGLMIFVGALFLIMSFSYAFMMYGLATGANRPDLLIAYGTSVGVIVTLMMTFANAYGTLFKSRDFELLASLPIESRVVVASKVASLTIIGYALFGLMYIPAVIMYFLIAGFNLLSLIVSIVVLLFGPLLITSLCSLVAYIVGNIVSHFKNKNTISTILYVIFTIVLILGIYAINFTMPHTEDEAVMQAYADNLYKVFTSIYPVSKIVVPAINGNLLYLLLYVAIMVVPYVLFVIIIGNKYVYINTHAKDAYKTSNYDISKEKNTKSRGLLKTLLQKEFKTLLATPVYLTNVVIGPVMSVAVIIFSAYILKYQIAAADENVAASSAISVNVVCAISLFVSGIAPASACSISIEGKRFWIIKSLPIDAKKYIRSKLLFSYLIMGPVMAIASVVASIIIGANVIDFICILLVPQVAALLYSLIGLLLNLKFYNLEWDNPTQAVKQGANVVLPMLIDFGIFGHLAGIVVVGIIFDISLTWAVLLVVSILSLVFYLIIRKHGVNLYNKIAA